MEFGPECFKIPWIIIIIIVNLQSSIIIVIMIMIINHHHHLLEEKWPSFVQCRWQRPKVRELANHTIRWMKEDRRFLFDLNTVFFTPKEKNTNKKKGSDIKRPGTFQFSNFGADWIPHPAAMAMASPYPLLFDAADLRPGRWVFWWLAWLVNGRVNTPRVGFIYFQTIKNNQQL